MENKEQIQQLLESIEKSEKRRESYARLQLIFSGAAAVLLLVFVLLLGNIVPEMKELISGLQTVSVQLADVDLESMVTNMDSLISNVNSLVADSQTGVSEAIKAIETIDLETLNKAINDFSDVIEPLAKFFNVFN